MMEVWDRLDEVVGSSLLTCIGMYAVHMGLEEIAMGCVAGVIAILAVKAGTKTEGGEKQ
jgi:hypothetical protein